MRILLSSSPLMKEWYSASIRFMLKNIHQYSQSCFLTCLASIVVIQTIYLAFKNLPIIPRPKKRCIILSNFSCVLSVRNVWLMDTFLSFHWLSVLNVSYVWQHFFVLVFIVLVSFAFKWDCWRCVTIQHDLNG